MFINNKILSISLFSLLYSLLNISFAQNQVISLLEINDLHAHLTSHKVIDPIDKKIVQRGGIARLGTLIKQYKQANINTLVMNVGDTFHGGVEAMLTKGNAIVPAVNALGIDIGTPGNWDFAYGPQVTRQRYGDSSNKDVLRPNFPNIAANVYNNLPRNKDLFLPATFIKQVAGITVGFIGLTSDIVPRMHPSLALGFTFLTEENDYINLINQYSDQLKQQKVDIIVVISELGIHKDFNLANKIIADSVDVFFSAHTHEAIFKPLISQSGALVVESGDDTYLGKMDITYNLDSKMIEDTQWQLINIDDTLSEDTTIKTLVDNARAPFLVPIDEIDNNNFSYPLSAPIDTILGQTSRPLFRHQALENNFNNAFTDILRDFAQTDIAMTPGFRFDSIIADQDAWLEENTLINENITLEDVYRFFPVPFTLSIGQVSGQRFKEIIESNLTAVFSKNIFKQSGGWTDGFSGIDLVVNLAHEDGKRIQNLSLNPDNINKTPINDKDILNIAGCSRPFDQESETTLCSYTGFTQVTPIINNATGEAWTGIDFLSYAFKNNLFNNTQARQNIIDKNQTPMWPNDQFIQPLKGAQKNRKISALIAVYQFLL